MVSDIDLFVLGPWIVFAAAVATITIVLFAKDRRVSKLVRRFRRRLRRRLTRRHGPAGPASTTGPPGSANSGISADHLPAVESNGRRGEYRDERDRPDHDG